MTAVQFDVPQLDDGVVALRLPTRADVTAYARAFTEDPGLGELALERVGLLDDEWSRR